MARYTVLAVNDSKDFCECCGRKGLKRVVWILDNETGEHKHFGTVCAAQPVKGFDVDKEIKQAITDHKHIEQTRARTAYHMYRARGGKYEAVAPGHWRVTDKALHAECYTEAAKRHPFKSA